jgi:hypothetical protein
MKSNINHSFVLYESKEWGGWWAVQTDERGVRKIPAENVPDLDYVECYECSKDLWPALRRTGDFVGDRYDWRGLLWGLFRLLVYRVFKRKITKPLHRDNRLFCSEDVGWVMKYGELPGAGYVDGYGPIKDTEHWKTSEISPLVLQTFWQASEEFERVDWPLKKEVS